MPWDRTLDDRILAQLDGAIADADRSVRGLERLLGVPKSTVAYHVTKLREWGFVTTGRDGRLRSCGGTRQLALTLDIASPRLAEVKAELETRGLLEEWCQIRGPFNVFVRIRMPFRATQTEAEQLMNALGAADVRTLGEVIRQADAPGASAKGS